LLLTTNKTNSKTAVSYIYLMWRVLLIITENP